MRFHLDDDQVPQLGRQVVVGKHDLATHPLFSDQSLAQILDTYPEERLFALTMGNDPTRPEDNERLLHRGLSGAELLQAVAKGRLWLNITMIDQLDTRFRELNEQLYAAVARFDPNVRGVETHATLLLSSPAAMVYYHVDAPASYLWHIRGRKRVWVYPQLDERFLSRNLLEDVFAGARHEYVPYESDFDQAATVVDLEPGDVAMWPHNAPHRVTNHDSINVSLVTDHYTAQGRWRARVYKANRFLRTCLHIPPHLLGTTLSSPTAKMKVVLHRLAVAAGLEVKGSKAHRSSRRRVDPTAPDAISVLESTATS